MPRRSEVIFTMLGFAAFASACVIAACGKGPQMSAGTGGQTTSGPSSSGPSTHSSSSRASSSGAGGTGGMGTGGAGGTGGAMPGGVAVVTQHNDNARSGANLLEIKLTTANVNTTKFGKLFARSVDDEVYAQVLYVPNLTFSNKGMHNAIFVATMSDTVYAFDADDPAQATPLWQTSFVDPMSGIVALTRNDVGQACGTYNDIDGNIGIITTPVIDQASSSLYVLARVKDMMGNAFQYLHRLDVTTGKDKPGSPVAIAATAPGMGAGSVNGMLTFDPLISNPRPALTLANGMVYLASASHCDTGNYHGWVLGYDATTLAQKAVWVSTPNGAAGGFWMSGAGATVDAQGNLYVVSGNGDFDANTGGSDYGESIIKLSPNLSVMDWFAPFDSDMLNAGDLDLGSAGPLLIPGTSLLAFGGKASVLYLADGKKLGHWNMADNSQILETVALGASEIHGAPVAWALPGGPIVYVWAANDVLRTYRMMNNQLVAGPTGPMAPDLGQPGGVLSLSANGSTMGTGILWATLNFMGDANAATVPGILYAIDAMSAVELWDSKQVPADDFGNLAKFNPPTIAAGKVFVPTFSNAVVVYGLK
jgi:hypothetical protein